MEKKDPHEIEEALTQLENKIPPSQISQTDQDLIKQAQNLQDKIESQKRIDFAFKIYNSFKKFQFLRHNCNSHFNKN